MQLSTADSAINGRISSMMSRPSAGLPNRGSRPPGYTGPLYWSPMNFASPEAIHWQQWNLCGGAQAGNGNFFVGLGGLPNGWQESNVNASRTVWGTFGSLPPTAYLSLQYSTTIAGSQAAGLAIDGTYSHSWTVNRWTGAFTDNGGSDGSNAPAAAAPYIFPAVPPNNSGAIPNQIATNNPAPLLSVSVAADGTSVSFVFALMFDNSGNATWTVIQTATLTNPYTMANVQTDALALLDGNQGTLSAMFDSMNWGQAASCVYNTDGSIQVTLSRLANAVTAPTTCVAFPTATGVGGVASVNQDFFSNAYSFSAAQADVCGQYCVRTFYCQRQAALVQCQNGSVDGFSPVTLMPPAFNASDGFVYSQLFPGSQC
jgi:hypothetical protein